MTSRLTLVLLVLVVGWTVFLGPGAASAAVADSPWYAERLLGPQRFRPHVVAHAKPHVGVGERAARYARRMLGVPYRYGGDSPRSGFDCSGLVRYVFGRFGLELPHSSYADFSLGRGVARSALQPGDLVFFNGLGHVGLYVGSGRFIHAPRSGTTVRIASLNDPWYRSSYEGARRVVKSRAAALRKR